MHTNVKICVCVRVYVCAPVHVHRGDRKEDQQNVNGCQGIFISSLFFSEHSNFSTMNFVTLKKKSKQNTQILQYLFSFK